MVGEEGKGRQGGGLQPQELRAPPPQTSELCDSSYPFLALLGPGPPFPQDTGMEQGLEDEVGHTVAQSRG